MSNVTQFVKDTARYGRRWLNELRGADLHWPRRIHRPSVHLGTEYGGWWVIPDLLPPRPLVFSVGIGSDISFDRAIIERFDAEVYGFDPTPKAVQWIARQQLPARLHFVPVGLAGFDGTTEFGLPRSDWDSYSTTLEPGKSVERVQCRVARLSTLMAEAGVSRVDVLKIDIEGAEYSALPDTLGGPLTFNHLLVELHYENVHPEELRQARELLELIDSRDYRLFKRSPVGREFCFVHRSVCESGR
jgi:FkbM family methyltransferase